MFQLPRAACVLTSQVIQMSRVMWARTGGELSQPTFIKGNFASFKVMLKDVKRNEKIIRLKKMNHDGRVLIDLTLIPYPGAIFVRTILFSSSKVETSVRKIWENLTFIFWYLDHFSAKKGSKIF